MVSYAELKSPFAGVVTQRHIDPGDLVRTTETASREPLFDVVQIDTVRACVMVPEKDVPFIRQGAEATLDLHALPGRSFTGRVVRVSGSLDESTRTMLVEVDVANPKAEIFPGMYGELKLVLEQRANAVVLPARAVRHDEQGHSFVFVVTAENVLRKTTVVTGMDTGVQIEILSPLDGSERIVDATIGSFKDGQPVQIQSAPATASRS